MKHIRRQFTLTMLLVTVAALAFLFAFPKFVVGMLALLIGTLFALLVFIAAVFLPTAYVLRCMSNDNSIVPTPPRFLPTELSGTGASIAYKDREGEG